MRSAPDETISKRGFAARRRFGNARAVEATRFVRAFDAVSILAFSAGCGEQGDGVRPS